MEKRTVSAKDIVADVKAGLTDQAIMQKYGLRREKLESVLGKLVELGVLTREQVEARNLASVSDAPPPSIPQEPRAPLPSPWQCPACGASQPQPMEECPRCGIVVAKYLRSQTSKPAPSEYELPGASTPPVGYGPTAFDSGAAASGTEPQDFDEPAREEYCPWEDYQKLGFFNALFLTAKESVTNPVQFFSQIPKEGGLGQPLLYGVILGSVGGVVGQFMMFLVQLFLRAEAVAVGMTFLSMILTPLAVVIGLFLNSGVFHLCLMIMGGANRSFETSFRAVCYTQAVALLSIVPCIGPLLYLVGAPILWTLGLREMHETTTGKAVGAVLLPLALCCGIIFVLFLFGFGVGLLASLSSG